MEPVENLISIDKELDSRINLLSLSSSKSDKNKSGTFIIENKSQKVKEIPSNGTVVARTPQNWIGEENSEIQKVVRDKRINTKHYAFNEKKYNPSDYKPKTMLPSEEHENGLYNIQNGQNSNCSGSDDEELQDYITKEVNAKIVSLKLKNNYLSQVLVGSEKKLKQMSLECDKNKKSVKEANKETIRSQKTVASLNELNAKTNKELKETKEKLAEKSRFCLELNKKITSFERTAREDNKKLLACQLQNNRLKEQLEASKIKINLLSSEQKNERETHSTQLSVSDKKCQELQNKVQTLLSLIKKQDELNIVLQQQKSNIAAAKAAMCLEDQFLSLIEPFKDLNS